MLRQRMSRMSWSSSSERSVIPSSRTGYWSSSIISRRTFPFSSSHRGSVPSNQISPLSTYPFESSNWMSDLPRVVFPHPDSPTRPNVSPCSTLKSTSSTAWTFDSPASYRTERSLTSSNDISAVLLRVGHVLHREADEVERRRDEHDADARRDEPPPRVEDVAVRLDVLEHQAPRVGGEVRESEVRQRRLSDDGGRGVLREEDERQRQDVGHDVAEHDSSVARARDLRGLDVRPFFQRQRLPADEDAVVQPRGHGDAEDDVRGRDAPNRHEDDEEGQEGKPVHHVDDALDGLVDPGVAVESTDESERDADQTR